LRIKEYDTIKLSYFGNDYINQFINL